MISANCSTFDGLLLNFLPHFFFLHFNFLGKKKRTLAVNEIMEAKEGVSSGVTVVGSDAPTSYHLAPRTGEVNANAGGSTPPPATQQPPESGVKKKRGRPRKYATDGSVTVALAVKKTGPTAGPAAGGVIDFSAVKRPRLKAGTNIVKQHHPPKFESPNLVTGDWVSCSVGANFTPHIITVNAGEDVTMKIISFSQQGPRAICILSANGIISSVTLRQPDSSGGTLTYEGRFEILSLTGSFMPSESGGIRNRTGGMSVSLASPDGRVVGGGVAGLLVAASPIQIVVGSFLAGNQPEQKPRKQKAEYIISTTPTAATPLSSIGFQESYRGHDHHPSG